MQEREQLDDPPGRVDFAARADRILRRLRHAVDFQSLTASHQAGPRYAKSDPPSTLTSAPVM